ncbi:MAG: hypothetical protein CL493_04555 [Actinobacteria bacterium]|nr:hypothetical protein [Actinomycetota bacterium]
MNNKLNLETVINTLSLIHSNEKWSIDNLCKHLIVNEKELFYLLSIITDLYSQHGELLIDYEYDEENREFLFNINSSIKNVTQINDGEFFNIFFLLSTNSIYKQLIKENRDVENFYNVLSKYFNVDVFHSNNTDTFDQLTFFEENIISYIKLGSTEEYSYRIHPISLTSNNDGIILEALDLDDDIHKTFLINRIVEVLDKTEYTNKNKTKNSSVDLKFVFNNEKVINSLGSTNIKVKNQQATVTFYSESNALDFALTHINDVEILSPQSIAKEISIRKTKLFKKLKS